MAEDCVTQHGERWVAELVLHKRSKLLALIIKLTTAYTSDNRKSPNACWRSYATDKCSFFVPVRLPQQSKSHYIRLHPEWVFLVYGWKHTFIFPKKCTSSEIITKQTTDNKIKMARKDAKFQLTLHLHSAGTRTDKTSTTKTSLQNAKQNRIQMWKTLIIITP